MHYNHYPASVGHTSIAGDETGFVGGLSACGAMGHTPTLYLLFHVLHLTLHVVLLCSEKLNFIQQFTEVLLANFGLFTLHYGYLCTQSTAQFNVGLSTLVSATTGLHNIPGP